MDEIDAQLAELSKNYPLVSHTNAGRLFSSVRRMKAEKEMHIPIARRTGFVISTKSGKRANAMTEQEWEPFYDSMCTELKRDYPDLHEQLFSAALPRGSKGAMKIFKELIEAVPMLLVYLFVTTCFFVGLINIMMYLDVKLG